MTTRVQQLLDGIAALRQAQRDYMAVWETGTPEVKEQLGAKVGEAATALDALVAGLDQARLAAYNAIDSERAYQEHRWNPDGTGIPRQHEIGAWLCFMDEYLARARTAVSEGDEHGSMNHVRKVTALGVVAMEQCGAYLREGFEK